MTVLFNLHYPFISTRNFFFDSANGDHVFLRIGIPIIKHQPNPTGKCAWLAYTIVWWISYPNIDHDTSDYLGR